MRTFDDYDDPDALPEAPDTPVGLWVDRSGAPRRAQTQRPIEQFRPAWEPEWYKVYAVCRKSDHLVLYIGSTSKIVGNRLREHIHAARLAPEIPFHRWLAQEPSRIDDLEIFHLESATTLEGIHAAENAHIQALIAIGAPIHNVKTGSTVVRHRGPTAVPVFNIRKSRKRNVAAAAKPHPAPAGPGLGDYRAVLAASAEARRARRKATRTA